MLGRNSNGPKWDAFHELRKTAFGRFCIALFVVLGCMAVPVLVTTMFGVRVIVISSEYSNTVFPIAIGTAIGFGAILFLTLLFGSLEWDYKGALAFATCIGVFALLAMMTVPPIAKAIGARKSTELQFVVIDSDTDRRGCRRGISLSGGVGFNQLCGLDRAFRETLRDGSVVMVKGVGSNWGVFPQEVYLVDLGTSDEAL